MNTMQIIKMCKNINADYKGMGREVKPEDTLILDTIMRIYNTTTEIDWEEVKWMWMTYLEKGVLPVSEALRMARVRINKQKGENNHEGK